MSPKLVTALARPTRGVMAAVRARPRTFGIATVAVLALHVLLPLIVLSLARKPVDYFTLNPWLSRLPDYLASDSVPWGTKLGFLSDLALAWFIADSPIEGVEWGFVIDVPSIARFTLTSLLFGTYFALWAHHRRQPAHAGSGLNAGQPAGLVGALMAVFGFSTGACSVMGCGVPVLPVVGLAVTGVSSTTLALFGDLARIGTWAVLVTMAAAVAWLGWLAGETPQRRPPDGPPARALHPAGDAAP